ncbi:Tannase/feruloyl esterase [Elsinoe ampelina]|uniref:Carboxylic ester hydrolase n=1 Tax=Elsinoe ampelina TaxID=302913 RepID=A0A6A6GDA3_9PEZI|nr:Tannase/feruloyl esterase [Elsinoe ampelina]
MQKTLSLIIGLCAASNAATLADLCTTSHVKSSVPADGDITGITIDTSSISAAPVYNTSVAGQEFYPDAIFEYCNISFAYSHNGRDDQVLLQYWLPSPANFQNRYLATGGGGLAISSGTQSLPGGIIYGAAAGTTDGGFGGFNANFGQVFLLANGTINYEALYMFGYRAIGEATQIGLALTKNFYDTSDKVYAYYQGCSEGGREGWSQVQKYGNLYDGVIAGAPAFRYGQQQVNHLTSNVIEKTIGYYPPPCEFEAILNATIAFCDPLDGLTDGVVSRTDLCLLHFNINSTIGVPYTCAASSGGGSSFGPGGGIALPAQNGTVTPQAAAVVSAIIAGLHDTSGKQAYISYQPSSGFSDAQTSYNTNTSTWGLSISSLGGEWITRFLQLTSASTLPSLDGVTYDTLRDWMQLGWQRYEDVLQTTWPDLSEFRDNGGKVLTFHGESDDSIPAGSSVHYHESVRGIMYPELDFNASTEALGEWYRLFLVPGAAHCAPNTKQVNGPFPQTNLAVLIDWVEKGVVPATLNATVLQGSRKGENAQICAWPLRPLWEGGEMGCVYDQGSVDTWKYKFDAYKLPLY